jgi:Flp pilus assembly protein TadD
MRGSANAETSPFQKCVYTSAIKLFKKAVKKQPENALYNYHLGLTYAKNGQSALAKQQLDRVAKLKPNSREVDELRKAMTAAKG